MNLFAYAFGLSLGPSLVGMLLALGLVKYALKTKLIKQLKIAAFLISVLLSAIVITATFPITDSANVVIGTTTGFVVTFLLGLKFRTKNNEEHIEMEQK
jgi:hypothetical protein